MHLTPLEETENQSEPERKILIRIPRNENLLFFDCEDSRYSDFDYLESKIIAIMTVGKMLQNQRTLESRKVQILK